MNFTMNFSPWRSQDIPSHPWDPPVLGGPLGGTNTVRHLERSDGVGGASGYIFVVDNGSFEARKKTSKRVEKHNTWSSVDQGKMIRAGWAFKYSSLESAETNRKSIFDIFGLGPQFWETSMSFQSPINNQRYQPHYEVRIDGASVATLAPCQTMMPLRKKVGVDNGSHYLGKCGGKNHGFLQTFTETNPLFKEMDKWFVLWWHLTFLSLFWRPIQINTFPHIR